MRNELTLSALRDAVTPFLAPIVREVSFDTGDPQQIWTLRGESTGITCEVEHAGNWFVHLDDWFGMELFPVGETRLVAFLTAFDVKPIQLVTARIRTRVVSTWFRFSNGMEFEDPTWRDKIIAMTPGYSLEVTPWVAGVERWDLIR
jgi:hypothetical protein